MKIAVIAANGRSGRAFVQLALEAGHTIHAGVHGSAEFAANNNLKVLPCDATNYDQILQLITGCDAVVSLIGHTKKSDTLVQTKAIQNILKAMQKANIKRLVSLTGTGVRLPNDKITMMDRVLNMSISIIDPNRINDGKQHAIMLQQSTVDWTIIRVLKLQNTDPKPFVLTEHGPTKLYVSRYDVAAAILQVLQDNSFIQQAPILSPAPH